MKISSTCSKIKKYFILPQFVCFMLVLQQIATISIYKYQHLTSLMDTSVLCEEEYLRTL